MELFRLVQQRKPGLKVTVKKNASVIDISSSAVYYCAYCRNIHLCLLGSLSICHGTSNNLLGQWSNSSKRRLGSTAP